jgi:hypothetical protein
MERTSSVIESDLNININKLIRAIGEVDTLFGLGLKYGKIIGYLNALRDTKITTSGEHLTFYKTASDKFDEVLKHKNLK